MGQLLTEQERLSLLKEHHKEKKRMEITGNKSCNAEIVEDGLTF